MNSTLVFVLLLVCIVMCSSVMREYIKQRKRAPEVNEDLEDTITKITLLEERVQVLERIITENRFDLRNEIDSL